MKKNPFQLALVVYLAVESDPNTQPVSGVYDLYESFIKLWIKRERLRGSSNSRVETIMKSLRSAANGIYTKGKWTYDEIAEENSAIYCLLNKYGSDTFDHPIATQFYHRSLATFILAQNIIDCFQACDYKTAKALLSVKYRDDVTNFVGDKVRSMKKEERETIRANLEQIYDKFAENDSNLSFHEQIIYFITRLDVNVDSFLLKIVSKNPQNLIMRMSLAYGCVLSQNDKTRQFALDYAKSIAQGSVDAKTNRGWTVVYFGDVNDRDPYTYLDDEKRPWAKARAARIARFTKAPPRLKDVRFWLFDIPLFRSFLEDRKWNDLSESEFEAIKSLSITDQYFNNSEIVFLEKEKNALVNGYTEHLKLK